MNIKHESREFCLQFLYYLQLPAYQEAKKYVDSTEIFERIQDFKTTLSMEITAEAQAYASIMIKGVLNSYDEIEQIISKYLKNWKLSRLSKIEHTILILATYELKYRPEVPGKVVINEAIELGKKYSTKESSSFINGILDNIFKQELNRHE